MGELWFHFQPKEQINTFRISFLVTVLDFRKEDKYLHKAKIQQKEVCIPTASLSNLFQSHPPHN